MARLFDFANPFYRPLWRRVLIVALCLGWATFEFIAGSGFWAVLFLAIGALCGYNFFVTRPFDE